jgi:hypothetical protein
MEGPSGSGAGEERAVDDVTLLVDRACGDTAETETCVEGPAPRAEDATDSAAEALVGVGDAVVPVGIACWPTCSRACSAIMVRGVTSAIPPPLSGTSAVSKASASSTRTPSHFVVSREGTRIDWGRPAASAACAREHGIDAAGMRGGDVGRDSFRQGVAARRGVRRTSWAPEFMARQRGRPRDERGGFTGCLRMRQAGWKWACGQNLAAFGSPPRLRSPPSPAPASESSRSSERAERPCGPPLARGD